MLADVFGALSSLDGNAICRMHSALHQTADFDMNRGADDAAAICFCGSRILKNEMHHPLVIAATAMSGGDASDRVAIVGGMVVASLQKEVARLIAQNSN